MYKWKSGGLMSLSERKLTAGSARTATGERHLDSLIGIRISVVLGPPSGLALCSLRASLARHYGPGASLASTRAVVDPPAWRPESDGMRPPRSAYPARH